MPCNIAETQTVLEGLLAPEVVESSRCVVLDCKRAKWFCEIGVFDLFTFQYMTSVLRGQICR